MQTFNSLAKEFPKTEEWLKEKGHDDIDTDSLAARLFSSSTYLKAHGVNLTGLPGHLQKSIYSNERTDSINRPFMVALLPCGIRNAFKEAFYEALPKYIDDDTISIEGNVNYEKSLYSYIDHITGVDELPDVFISSDINSLYHKKFLDRLSGSDAFEKFDLCYDVYFEDAGLQHPEKVINIFTANLLVMVVNNKKFENSSKPYAWYELLCTQYRDSIVMRGDGDFFCNAALYPYYAAYGEESMRILGINISKGVHPAEMVKEINSNRKSAADIYIMPYSFACKIRNEKFSLVWPEDGAIVSPVQILVKKGAKEKHKDIIDFIFGSQLAETMEQQGFPAFTQDNLKRYPGKTLKWLGWEFIYKNDIGTLKDKTQEVFFEYYKDGNFRKQKTASL
ncbi:MAG: ABC transporter substrate-binding protein [Ignavibacteria bacterium]|jgi:ABC-type Fe3+ transport system substrate-binding protein